jgi:hypothetical protein
MPQIDFSINRSPSIWAVEWCRTAVLVVQFDAEFHSLQNGTTTTLGASPMAIFGFSICGTEPTTPGANYSTLPLIVSGTVLLIQLVLLVLLLLLVLLVLIVLLVLLVLVVLLLVVLLVLLVLLGLLVLLVLLVLRPLCRFFCTRCDDAVRTARGTPPWSTCRCRERGFSRETFCTSWFVLARLHAACFASACVGSSSVDPQTRITSTTSTTMLSVSVSAWASSSLLVCNIFQSATGLAHSESPRITMRSGPVLINNKFDAIWHVSSNNCEIRLMDEILHHLTWVTCREWEESGMGVRCVRDESEMRMWLMRVRLEWEADATEMRILWERGWDASEIEMRLTCEWDANDLRVHFLSHFWEHPKDCKEWTPAQVRQDFELVWNRSNSVGFW